MNHLPTSLYGQRVWYKLPFETQEDRKALYNGDENFKKMCLAAQWTKSIDIFVEADVGDENVNRNEEEEARDEYEQFDEERRVESNVAAFGDVDDEYDEYATPVESGDEDQSNDDGYVRYIKGSGELKFKQVFDSLEAFKKAVVEYVLHTGRNIKYVRWEKDKSELKCASGCHNEKETGGENPEKNGENQEQNPAAEGDNPVAEGENPAVEGDNPAVEEEEEEPCSWRVYCSYETTVQKWVVKVFNDDHSCLTTGYSKIITQEVIARLFVNDIRENPKLMPKKIQEEIQKRWNLIASNDQCRKAKGRALEIIQKEHDEQYSRLKDYRLELLE